MQPKVSVDPGTVVAETDHIHVYAEHEVIYVSDDLSVVPVVELIEVGAAAHVADISIDSNPVVGGVRVSNRTGISDARVIAESSYVSGAVGHVSVDLDSGATKVDSSWSVENTSLTDSPVFDIVSSGAIAIVEFIQAIALQTGTEFLQLFEVITVTDDVDILLFLQRDFDETITVDDSSFLAELGIILTPLFDEAFATDDIDLSFGRSFDEQLLARDSIPVPLADSSVNADAINEYELGGIDAFAPQFAIDFTKILSDSQAQSDSIVFDNSIELPDDSVTAIENIAPGLNYFRDFGGYDVFAEAVNGLPVNEGTDDIEGVYVTAQITDYRWNIDAESFVIAGDEIYSGQVNADLLHDLALHESRGPTILVFKDITKVLSDSLPPSDAIDSFNLTKVIADTQVITELVEKDISIPFADTLSSPTDDVVYHVDKNVSDTQAQSDAIDSFTIGKVLEETPVVTESDAKDVTKNLDPDSAPAVDAAPVIGFNVFRDFLFDEITSPLNGALVNEWPVHYDDQADAVIVNDHGFDEKLYEKNLTETLVASEQVDDKDLQVAKSETLVVSELVEKLITQGTVAETLSATDAVDDFNISKPFSDSVTPGDGIEIVLEKSLPVNEVPVHEEQVN